MAAAAALYAFEGPDGVGKTAIVEGVAAALAELEVPTRRLSFPGSRPGTLGEWVYNVHHDTQGMRRRLPALSIQALHVAAHIDAIENEIRPAWNEGMTIVLDRYWWSTWVYGRHAEISESVLRNLIAVEEAVWDRIQPTRMFLIRREAPFRREQRQEVFLALSTYYEELASVTDIPVTRVENDRPLQGVINGVMNIIRRSFSQGSGELEDV